MARPGSYFVPRFRCRGTSAPSGSIRRHELANPLLGFIGVARIRTVVGIHQAVPFGTHDLVVFCRASVSPANTAGIAGAFSSASTVDSTQIIELSCCLGSISFTSGQDREGWNGHLVR